MMRLGWILAALALATAARGNESKTQSKDDESWLGKHVKLQRSLEDRNEASKPAELAVTFPSGGKPTLWAINAGLKAADCFPGACQGGWGQLEWNIGVEYHRQTDTEKPQNTLGVALGVELLAGIHNDILLTTEFKSDNEKSIRSVTAYLDYSTLDVLRSGLV